MPKRVGRKSASQTPAPKSDKIYGSKKNKTGSASELQSKGIKLSEKTENTLKEKLTEFKENNPSKKNISISDLKAVYRRGSGAYSSSHRPTITGGAPNSRAAWSYARVNKFLEKAAGKPVKKAYVQDDDLMAKGGRVFDDKELLSRWKNGESIGFTAISHLKAKGLIPRADGEKRKSEKYMEDGGQTSQEIQCVNCGWKWETADSDEQDMYICHQCGFDNTLYYINIMSKLKKPMSVSEISQEHGVSTEYIDNQLIIGIKHELEHTDDEGIARIIALHHIGEKPNYYELVEKYKLEDGGQPSKFFHKAEKYEIADFIKNERIATKELLCSSDTRISKAIICRAKIDFFEKKERNTSNFEIKNAWSEVKNIWEDCLLEVKNGVIYEFKDGGECGCTSKSYKDGGLAYGNSHDKGGMPLKVESTGQNIEIEGGEGVINKRSMQIKKRIDFEGKKLTPCQIVSKINEMGGGVKFKCEDVEEILEKDGKF
jgi:hypothetical protein